MLSKLTYTKYLIHAMVVAGILCLVASGVEARSLEMFKKTEGKKPCYNRTTQPQTPVVDAHIHPQPFGGRSIPYPKLMQYFTNSDTHFALLFGIGQTLPWDSVCTYYLDCVGTPATPSMKNDFENAANYLEHSQKDVHIILSMTFPDLANPENIVAGIKTLDAEYKGLFRWMGEVNLHKEALVGNHHEPATLEDIANWKNFMAILQERGIPITIHADLGDNDNPTEHLHLMREVLRLYPDNKIIWAHMGLSRELVTMDPAAHIALMSKFLDANPNLYLDISWTVLAEAYFNSTKKRALYVDFFNTYPTRVLSGTDFVGAWKKGFQQYEKEAQITGSILAELNDEAFRQIALGQNYFDLVPGMAKEFEAPQVCK